MCGLFGQYRLEYKQSLERKDFKEAARLLEIMELVRQQIPKNLRIDLFKEATIIPQSNPDKPINAVFSWTERIERKNKAGEVKETTWPVFNVRAEGGWGNKANDPNYKGSYGIFTNPYVKDLIETNKCIIPCDFFVEQPTEKGNARKFVITHPNKNPIYLASIYKDLIDASTGEILGTHFTIITTAYNTATAKALHERSPVIVPKELIFDYLSAGKEELKAYFVPNNEEPLITYEVDPSISKKNNQKEPHDESVIEPINH